MILDLVMLAFGAYTLGARPHVEEGFGLLILDLENRTAVLGVYTLGVCILRGYTLRVKRLWLPILDL